MAFVNGCVAAGPNGCAFFAPAAAEILANLDKLYASLRARPIPVRTNTSFSIVNYSTLRFTIFRALYEPYALFPPLAEALADLTKDNATALFKTTEKPAFKCACDPSQHESVGDAGQAVICNDGKRFFRNMRTSWPTIKP